MKNLIAISAMVLLSASAYAAPTSCEHFTPVLLNTANSFTQQVVTGIAGKQTRICSVTLFSINGNSLTNVRMVEGTGGNCASGTVGMIGGSAPGTGMVLSPNLFLGAATSGSFGVVAVTATLADDVCLISNSNDVSGVISWAQL